MPIEVISLVLNGGVASPYMNRSFARPATSHGVSPETHVIQGNDVSNTIGQGNNVGNNTHSFPNDK